MRFSRARLALVSATIVTASLVAPVSASASEPLSTECTAQVEAAKAEGKGPETVDCYNQAQAGASSTSPELSSKLTEIKENPTAQIVFAVLGGIATLTAAVLQGVVSVAKANPAIKDQISQALKNVGINL